jgi:3-oxoacyl-(acyl-carrier-protein) synthase
MRNYYINGIGCVSSQESSDTEKDIKNYEELTTNIVSVKKPDYKKHIIPSMVRRMSIGVKMGVVASSIALKEANIEIPDAIITGSGMGCLRDSEKFLTNILDNDEQFLTPTAFIQSTHNTVGAQVALGLGCKAYNVTYVHDATSFETSLVDAMMMIDEGESKILVGGVDEIGKHTAKLYQLIDLIKKEESFENGVLNTNTKGAIYSEGAQFFVLENEKSKNTYAKLLAVTHFNQLEKTEVSKKLELFLKENKLSIPEIDAVVLGLNGDVNFDNYYKNLQNNLLKNTPQIAYKQFSGEYNTASAFGTWVACNVLKNQDIPTNFLINSVKKETYKNVLLYNQYRSENHSFILLSSC